MDTAADSAVAVAGLVTHRQRPPTARGVVFLSLEDETGMLNVICPPHVWARHRQTATTAPALLIYGRIERTGGAVNLVATALRPLRVALAARPSPAATSADRATAPRRPPPPHRATAWREAQRPPWRVTMTR